MIRRQVMMLKVGNLLMAIGAGDLAAQVPPRSGAGGSTDTAQLVGPPIRRIESAVAVSKEPLGAVTNIRVLTDGRVLLNDGARRRLLMLDTALNVTVVILDSLTEIRNAYGAGAGALLAYRGDSSLFIDPATLAMLVLDPAGRTARVRSVPRAENTNRLTATGGNAGYPAFDAKGRLVYRIPAVATFPTPRPPRGVPYFRVAPDSAFVVGIDLETRKVDTIGSYRVQPPYVAVRRNANGTFSTSQVNNPLPLMDDWAVLSDGTVAFVRGRDYRIEWVQPDGSLKSSGKLPFPWVRLDESDKERMADSIRAIQMRNAQVTYTMQLIFWTYQVGRPYPDGFVPPPRWTPPNGLPRDVILPKGVTFPATYRYACPIDGSSNIEGARAAQPAASTAVRDTSCIQNPFEQLMMKGYFPPPPTYRAPNTIPASELPDYRPPFGASATRADADGNLWIRTIPMKPTPGGAVFDIVNRSGELTDRIQIPSGYAIAGFGAGRVVYLTMRDASGLHLAKVRLK